MADNHLRRESRCGVILPWLLLVLCLLRSESSCDAQQTCDAQDSAALLEFKAGLIDEEGYFASWNGTTDCCAAWQGVTCDPSSRRVVQLTMFAFFGKMRPMRDEKLSAAQVGASLGQLTALRVLNIANILFDGGIPQSIGDLSELEYLSLQYTGLRGAMPDSLCRLTKLLTLNLNNNEITGSLPSCIIDWVQITTIRVASNNLTGTIPAQLSELSTLQELDLSDNYLEGPVPVSLQGLQRLAILSLSENFLNGSIPSDLTDLKSLRIVAFDHNHFTGGVSSWWYRLVNLTYFALNDNELGGNIYLPDVIEQSSPLETLYLQNNRFEGEIPQELGNFPSSLTVDLSNNLLTGTVPESLGNNTDGTLLLSDNELTGGFPLSLARLQSVHINRNKLNILTAIGTVPGDGYNSISVLELGGNQLAGPWPAWVTELVNLTSLDLSSNKIYGPIPQSLLAMPLLEYSLNVSNNPLDIMLPGGNFTSNVGILDMSNCQLSGELGVNFFRSFPSVSSLYLGENRLSGEFPPDLLELLNPSINIVDLSNNRFTGRLPRFSSLQFLMFLDVLGNSFSLGPM